MARRALPACLGLALALFPLLAGPVRAADPARPAPPERADTVLGTGGGATQSGRDPSTGDTVLQVTPQEQPREQHPLPPALIQPEVRIPAGQARKPAGQ